MALTNVQLRRIAESYALTLDGFTPRPVRASYDCLYEGKPCVVKATRQAGYTQSSEEQIAETAWWLWVLIDDETGGVLAHELVSKSEHHFGGPYVYFKYMAPPRVLSRFSAVLGRRSHE